MFAGADICFLNSLDFTSFAKKIPLNKNTSTRRAIADNAVTQSAIFFSVLFILAKNTKNHSIALFHTAVLPKSEIPI